MAMSRVVLITGCSRGIGLSTALLLAKDQQQRFKVYATMRDISHRDSLEQAAREQLGKTLVIKSLDVTSDESVSEALQSIYEEEGRIDVLINNAGIRFMGILETHSIDRAKEILDTNFFGVVRLTKGVIPKMKVNRMGHVINISSMAGMFGSPFRTLYCASKFAVEGFSESLAPLLRHFDVRISLIQPGPVNSSFESLTTNAPPIVDNEKADVDTKQLLDHVHRKLVNAFASNAQSSDEIAEFILDVLIAEEVHLRYSTNKDFVRRLNDTLTDPTGDNIVDMMYERFFS